MQKVIPFAPLPLPVLRKLSAPLSSLGMKVQKMFPKLGEDLSQADMGIHPRDYASIMVFSSLFYFIVFGAVITILLTKFITTKSFVGGIAIPHFLLVGIVIGLTLGVLVFTQMLAYPKILIKKRVRLIEMNLVYALRTMLVQIKSGVSLFDSLAAISFSNRFGQLSKELRGAVESINTGVAEEVALRELAAKNPSPYLKKVVWQLVNGMRAGADVTDVLAESVSSITREQEISIQGYGSSLRILSLMYLMIGVIIPALGLTFLIVIGSFPKIKITEITFWALLGGIVLAEFMFLGIMKAKRPNLMGAA